MYKDLRVSIIVATSKNGVIGKENALPWHIPEDLKRFKKITMGHPIIMGRKTFESIGRPLPGRRNIVLSKKHKNIFNGVEVFSSLNCAISFCKAQNEKEIFIIGGEQIYREAMDFADRIYLTLIEKDYDGDAFFPKISLTEFEVVEEKVAESDFLLKYLVLDRK